MIALILIRKIISLVIILLMGVILVKSKVLKSTDSKIISALTIYLVCPCSLITAFQVDYTPEIRDGLLLALFASFIIHIFLLTLNVILKRVLKLNEVEQLSLVYSNAGNLVIPLVSAILGEEWVIYTCAYMAIQNLLIWSHGRSILCGEKGIDLKKVFSNPNILAIILGLIMFSLRIKLPTVLADSTKSVSSMLGPSAMIVTGMLMADMDLKKILTGKRLWRSVFFRLVLVPVCTLCIIKFSGLTHIISIGPTVLLITLIATITPSASSITNMAQVYNKDAVYASAINVASTILCVITMPIIVALYQL